MPNWTDRPPIYGAPDVNVRAWRGVQVETEVLVVPRPPVDFAARLELSRQRMAEARERFLRPYLEPDKGA